jgi:Flp pilus assembly protein TadD
MADLLAQSIARLESMLLAAGQGMEESLSADFRGASLLPAHETSLREDSAFKIRRSDWAEKETQLAAAEFAATLRRFLAPHAPLGLADLACVGISGSPDDHPTDIRTRLRFELGGTSTPDHKPRWQATGQWEIQWAQSATGWKIAAWRPLEMVTVEGPAVVFTDVTEAAFGKDPSYRSHLLRDTNYWRGILDKASGIDIFGNSGVSVGDVDGDGRDEIYMCQPQGLPNRLYRQHEPGIFKDTAHEAGVDVLDNTSMALFADVLNRGHQDLILITETSPLLFLNDGRGHFTLKGDAFPPGATQAALTGAAMADYDRDGYLDLYVCAYGYVQGEGSILPCPYYDAQNGPPNRLFHNQGDGTFVDVTTSSGLDHGNNRFSFACTWNDIDDDGWPDLAVVNDFGHNNLYHNLRNGTFEEWTDALAGYGSGMSACFADLNGDGAADLYVSNMSVPAGERISSDPGFERRFRGLPPDRVRQFVMGNALYVNSKSGPAPIGAPRGLPLPITTSFRMAPNAAGARRGRWAWCSDALDLESLGALDLYVVNGYLSPPLAGLAPLDAYLWEEVVALSPRTNMVGNEYRAAWAAISQLAHEGHPWNGNERNVFFLSLRDGNFSDASAVTGLDFRDDGRAFAVFDFDGDGDADLVLRNRTGPQLRLLRNDLANSSRSIAFRFTGTKGNRDAIGTRIEVETPGGRQIRFLGCGTGFLSQHSKELVIGLGAHAAAIHVRVRWPSGDVAEYTNLEAGHRYFLMEGEPSPKREPFPGLGSRGPGLEGGPPAQPPQADVLPAHFSTGLVEPLPVPLPQPLQGARLLWLWDPAEQNSTGLETLLRVQEKVPSRLVLWGEGSAPSSVVSALENPPWQADEHFRLLCATLLAYLYDYLRQPVFPTALLFEAGGVHQSVQPSKLVKVYWGGGESAEILKDVEGGTKTGQSALPFPGRAILCSFSRDLRTLGAGLAMAGLFQEAEIYLAKAGEANRKDADALYNLAVARERLGRTRQAILDARRALEARPQFPQAKNLLGVLLSQSGHPEEAKELLQQATKEMPDFVEAWNNLGYLELLRGNLREAQAALERALTFAPEYTESLNNLGILKARQAKPREAEVLFHRVLALEPDNEKAANNLAVIYANEGKLEEAEQILQGLLQRDPEDESTLLNLARLDLSLGKSSEAKKLLQGWLARHPDDTTAQKLLEGVR